MKRIEVALNYTEVYAEVWIDDICLQESLILKERWLKQVEQIAPVGRRVQVDATNSDDEVTQTLHGRWGVVTDHYLGVSGEWPTIQVQIDDGPSESFYDSELNLEDDE